MRDGSPPKAALKGFQVQGEESDQNRPVLPVRSCSDAAEPSRFNYWKAAGAPKAGPGVGVGPAMLNRRQQFRRCRRARERGSSREAKCYLPPVTSPTCSEDSSPAGGSPVSSVNGSDELLSLRLEDGDGLVDSPHALLSPPASPTAQVSRTTMMMLNLLFTSMNRPWLIEECEKLGWVLRCERILYCWLLSRRQSLAACSAGGSYSALQPSQAP